MLRQSLKQFSIKETLSVTNGLSNIYFVQPIFRFHSFFDNQFIEIKNVFQQKYDSLRQLK